MQDVLSLSPSVRFNQPYPHAVVPEVIPTALAEPLLAWLETSGPWRLTRETFYEQYEFSLLHADLPETLAPLIAPATVESLKRQMGEHFQAGLRGPVEIIVHRL